MNRVEIVVPDDFPIAYGSPDHPELARLRVYGEVVTHTTRYADRAEFFERIGDAEVVINVRAYSTFDEQALERAPKLRMISVLGVGTDNIDLAAARRRGVTVINTPHLGGVTAESNVRSNKIPVDNIIAFLEGRPQNVVNPELLQG